MHGSTSHAWINIWEAEGGFLRGGLPYYVALSVHVT